MKKGDSSEDPPVGLHILAYRLLGGTPTRIFPLAEKVRDRLMTANIRVNHVIYISSMFFWSIIAAILPFPITFLTLQYVLPPIGIIVPLQFSLLYSLLISLASGGITFLVFFYYPSYAASSLKISIEKNLVYVANYMAILSSAGATPGETFASLARVGEVFGLKESARSIIRNVELLGEDVLTALDVESKRTPSREYADFLQGYIATLRTGGNLQTYLMAMSRKFIDDRRRLLSKMISQLNLAGELFVAALVALPIIMVTVLSIMGFFGGEVLAGLSAPQIMALMVYIFIPFTAIGVLIFIDAVMSSW